MSAFVILAAGRGSRIGRVGDTFHKALVPLGRKAVLSHLFDLAPNDARIIICLGHRGQQIRDYVEAAHPNLKVTYVHVKGWDEPGGGPGHSLLAAREAVGDDTMIFTSCDTLWTVDHTLWTSTTWAALAAIPAGTPMERWCRMQVGVNPYGWDRVTSIVDKEPSKDRDGWYAYTGLAQIMSHDLPRFWAGIEASGNLNGELQVTGGLNAVADVLDARHINWIDVGDEEAYSRAIARLTGYDFTKLDEATYVLPEQGRVVKFMADSNAIVQRRSRALQLRRCVPRIIHVPNSHMLAYEYIPGVTGYQAVESASDPEVRFAGVLSWADTWWNDIGVDPDVAEKACEKFYYRKTFQRIMMLDDQNMAADIVNRVDFDEVIGDSQMGVMHGDFNLGNIIWSHTGKWVGIDWRQEFGGISAFGDIRYDLAKLLAGTVIHWDRAQTGDFRPWPEGEHYAELIRRHPRYTKAVEIIAALSLINSAPLHASPLDEVLVARACGWLERLI